MNYEDINILDEAMILSASNVDMEASSKVIGKVKEKFNKLIASGKYRAYKSSDSGLIQEIVKSKGMLKQAGMTIAGSIIGAGLGYVGSKGSRGQIADKLKRMKSNSTINKVNSTLDGEPRKALPIKEDILFEAVEKYLSESFDEILNEIEKVKADSVVKADGSEIKLRSSKSLKAQDGIATGAGAVAGGAAGNALARKIVNSMKYKLFTLNGLTILSFYSTDKEGNAKGKSVCYAVLIKNDGHNVLLQRINLKAKN